MSVWVTGGVSTRSLPSRTPKARQGVTLFSPQWYISAPTAAHPPGALRSNGTAPLERYAVTVPLLRSNCPAPLERCAVTVPLLRSNCPAPSGKALVTPRKFVAPCNTYSCCNYSSRFLEFMNFCKDTGIAPSKNIDSIITSPIKYATQSIDELNETNASSLLGVKATRTKTGPHISIPAVRLWLPNNM